MEGVVRVVGELGAGERVAVEVVDRDDLVALDELARERRRDEAGAAGDQDPFAFEHRAECNRRPIVSPMGDLEQLRAEADGLRDVSAAPAGAGSPRGSTRAAEPLARAQRAFNDVALRLRRRALRAARRDRGSQRAGGAARPRARGAPASARAARTPGGENRAQVPNQNPRPGCPAQPRTAAAAAQRGQDALPDYFAFEARMRAPTGRDQGAPAALRGAARGPASPCSIWAAGGASCSGSSARRASTARGVDGECRHGRLRRRARVSTVVQADALAALAEVADGSLGAVTALQLVEHLPPAVLVRLLELAAAKVTARGRADPRDDQPGLAARAPALLLRPHPLAAARRRDAEPAVRNAGFREAEIPT